MGLADLSEVAATPQQNLYAVSQRCEEYVFYHTNLRTTGIRKAARGIDFLPCAAKP
jgi:hypothetical protein